MIGTVVISHSEKAAEGAAEIAAEMAGEEVDIESVGGNKSEGLGTNVPDIVAAIRAVNDGDGVVVLVDLGSSVVNARTAISKLEVTAEIADAPLLEGALNAAVESTDDTADLEAVVSAAERARTSRKLN